MMTIDSDDEVSVQLPRANNETVQLDMDFVFDPSIDTLTETWNDVSDLRDFVKTGSRPVRMAFTSVCSIYCAIFMGVRRHQFLLMTS